MAEKGETNVGPTFVPAHCLEVVSVQGAVQGGGNPTEHPAVSLS